MISHGIQTKQDGSASYNNIFTYINNTKICIQYDETQYIYHDPLVIEINDQRCQWKSTFYVKFCVIIFIFQRPLH